MLWKSQHHSITSKSSYGCCSCVSRYFQGYKKWGIVNGEYILIAPNDPVGCSTSQITQYEMLFFHAHGFEFTYDRYGQWGESSESAFWKITIAIRALLH